MKILVVEDEKKVASFIKRGLEDDNYKVAVAYDGLDGFKQARDGDYNLVIMDMMLPKKDGMSVIKDLREGGNRVPVLMLTARDNMEDIVSGLDAGSDDYLTKPFAFAELLARVRALLRRGELDRGAEIRFADLRLDPVSHKVWRGSKEIDLTSKEYGLL
ncbi:MAG TPA: response regulator transcription factor, partial [Candidatus Acidoferrum sp.]|nr:response regulator transcription factor [Candidatus Acidoferrum sp.]